MLKFKTIKWQNFLSTGNQWTEIFLNRSPSTLIVGENGSGKCLRGVTQIDVRGTEEAEKALRKFLERK